MTHRFDNRLHGDARLARPGRHADHPAPFGTVHAPVAEHVSHLGDDGLLVVVEIRKQVWAFDFKIWIAVPVPLSSPFGGESERIDEIDSSCRSGPLSRRARGCYVSPLKEHRSCDEKPRSLSH